MADGGCVDAEEGGGDMGGGAEVAFDEGGQEVAGDVEAAGLAFVGPGAGRRGGRGVCRAGVRAARAAAGR